MCTVRIYRFIHATNRNENKIKSSEEFQNKAKSWNQRVKRIAFLHKNNNTTKKKLRLKKNLKTHKSNSDKYNQSTLTQTCWNSANLNFPIWALYANYGLSSSQFSQWSNVNHLNIISIFEYYLAVSKRNMCVYIWIIIRTIRIIWYHQWWWWWHLMVNCLLTHTRIRYQWIAAISDIFLMNLFQNRRNNRMRKGTARIIEWWSSNFIIKLHHCWYHTLTRMVWL